MYHAIKDVLGEEVEYVGIMTKHHLKALMESCYQVAFLMEIICALVQLLALLDYG